MRAKVNGSSVLAGNARLLAAVGIDSSVLTADLEALAADGKTPMLAAVDGRPAGVVAVADTIKAGSVAAIAGLAARGIDVVMMPGDNRATAAAIAGQVGIGRVVAEVITKHKARESAGCRPRVEVSGWSATESTTRPPSPKPTSARAIGTGTDVAIEASDITLISGNLAGLVTAIDLSRATMRNIRQNLGFAFGYNIIGIPLAAGVLYPAFGLLLSPMIAALAMALSSLSVVSTSSRLRQFTPKPAAIPAMAPTTDPVIEIGNQNENKDTPMTHDHETTSDNTTLVSDPGCGMNIDPKTAAATREHDGTTVYFCSTGCAASFDADPHKYGHPHAH